MKARILKVLAIAFAIVLIAATVGLLVVTRSKAMGLVHPERLTPDETPADFGTESSEEVVFQSSDGLDLVGWFIHPNPDRDGATVIFVHGLGNSRDHMLPEAAMLAEHGYGGLVFALRNHGASEGDVTTFGVTEVNDVRGAVDYLLTQEEVNPDRLAIVGHSMGGGVVIMASAQIPEIKVIVAESSFTSLEDNVAYGVQALTGLPPFPFAPLIVAFVEAEADFDLDDVRPIDYLDQIAPRPILFIHGEEDEKVHISNLDLLYEAAYEPKGKFQIPNAMHRINLVEADQDEFENRLVGFLDAYLR